MWKKFLFFFLFSLSLLAAQDVQHNPLLLITEILNGFDLSINRLQENMNASSRIIDSLQKTNSSMSATIEAQQRELNQVSTSYQNFQQTAQERYNGYEVTLKSLETSLTKLSQENQEKGLKILSLTEKNARLINVLFIMGGIIVLLAIFLIKTLFKQLQ